MLEEMQGFRLSPQQKHLWQLQETDNFPYHSLCAVLIEGDLDISTLKLALEKVVNRHEILRTNFHCLPGMTIPFQVIKNNGIAWGETYDLSSCSQLEQAEILSSLFEQLGKQQFDFVQGSSLRLSLISLSPSKYVLLISLPALCADATTLKILVQEISLSYTACLDNEELENEPLQYADLAEWQNELLEGEDTEAGRDYWLKQDISSITELKLPGEETTFQQIEFLPQTQTFIIISELLEKIEKFVQQHHTSVSEFLLACWQVLLCRLTQQRNIIVGLGVEGRKYQDLKAALGLFTQYLPIDIKLQAESSILDILQQNYNNKNKIYKYQEYFNWEQIAGNIPTGLRYFPVCFEFEEQAEKYVASDVSFSIYQQYTCIKRFKIKLVCLHRNQTITAAFHYDSNLFCPEDIQRLAEQFQTLLASAIAEGGASPIANANAPISQLDILSNNEKQLINKVNKTKQEYPQKCIHQLFEEQAQKTPNNIAVVFEDQQLTYRELNQRANQLARYLQKQGVGAEILVGLCVERSLEMIVGLLGILKAGAAYIPLDPGLPTEVLAARLQDSQASFLVSHSSVAHKFEPITTIYLNQDWEAIACESDTNPSSKVTIDNLAYVLFTSGSTGKAKGVAVEHQQLFNYVNAIIEKLNLTECTNFALISTLAADLGNTVLFPSVCTGGCLHVISYECATDPTAFAEYCRKYPIDCLKIVPSHISSLLLSSTPKSILPRQRLVLGGEAATWQLIEQIQKYTPDCQIFNHYGPTEATVGVLTHSVEDCKELSSKTVPLGKPLANTQVYVLEEQLKLAPIGVKGEVYIGGAGLARCYLDQPELTAVKFIPNPFSEEPGTRLYKTGDLGRYLPDSTIEFLGRSDYQVKIRGFRIELAEIEVVLCQHPLVRESVVVAREEASGEKRLVAYLVPKDESLLENAKLSDWRSFLTEKLPDYMVPSSFVILPTLPLTSNGKVNRQELPAPEEVQRQINGKMPRTPVEEVIAGIWSQILNLEQVGIDDNFFELGGHSLLATQIASKIREALQVDLPLRSLFELPTVAALAEHIEKLLKDSQELELPPIQKVGRDRPLPLSFSQARLWFLEQWQPGSSYYNFSIAVRLQGLLNIAALEQSLNEIVRRHEALRTTFTVVDEQPVQKITPTWSIRLPVIDLRELPRDARIAETQRLAKLEAKQSFDLTNGPLLNIILLQQAEEEYVLILTMHHIISDAWSSGVIVRELTALYDAFCTGKSSPLPELPIQYADFAVWQREYLQKERLASQMGYWKQQLGGNLPVLQLPTDRPRPAIQTSNGQRQSFELSSSLTQALKTLSQQEGVTLFMTLLAAFQTLLYRYTGQEDILVGSPIANRNRSEIEGLIGFFVNTLVLRTDLSGNPSFRELLKRVREVTLGAYTHQDLPFEQLVEELQPERNLSYSPIFQVMFALQNTPIEKLKLPGLTINLEEVATETSTFDLTLLLRETNKGLMGVFEYNSDLFDTETISRIQGHFQRLLEGTVAGYSQKISDLPILTVAEQKLFNGLNQTGVAYTSTCIHQLFEAQVERTPDAIAVVFEQEQLTYRKLNQRANQLAHYLQKLGVRPEVLVGICVERSLEMVIGILGILKAGGAYLPLDPAYPQERIAFMLADAKVSIALTQQKLVTELPPNSAQIVCLDDPNWELIAQESSENLQTEVRPENLAYVIYTSGSTGQSKGVMVQHSSLTNAYLGWEKAYELRTFATSHLQMASFSFDVFTGDLVRALCSGGKLVLCPRELLLEPEKLYELMQQEEVDCAEFVPAVLRNLILYLEQNQKRLDFMRLIICGSDSWYVQEYEKFLQFCGSSTRLINSFGITESTIDSTYFETQAIGLSVERLVPIGSAFANTQIHILDTYFQPVPIGVIGEIYIGGSGVARGYLNQPGLTAEKFIPNLYSQKPGDILYKTGDLGRYLPDGNIELVGRIDNQIKIRGFRIELGEIESVLNQHPDVQATVVVVREDKPGDQRLVAYVVPNAQKILNTSEIRSFLQEKLPKHMLPTAFVFLDKLPLTPNGKVDRRALPAPGNIRTNLEQFFVAPRNSVEEGIAEIWQQVLGVEQVGIDDNFFELGGHSLLATQVISRLRKTLEIDLPLRYLFEYPTVAELAKTIQQTTKTQLGLNIPPIQRVHRDENLPLSFAQGRLWLQEQLYPGTFTYNISAAVHFAGCLNVAALEQSLNEIVQRHEALRTIFSLVNGQAFQAIAPTLTIQLPIIDLCHVPAPERGAEVERLAIAESHYIFDLTQLPLLRCTLLHLGENEHIVLLTIHHIVSDGWSMGVFIQELATLYATFCAGETSRLPELPIQYADFAVWQRQWLQGEVLQTQLDYWQQQLQNLPILELPTDFPRPPERTFRGAKQTLVLDNSLSQALKQLSTETGVTLFMTLLASFQTLLHWYTNQDDIVVGTDVANRNQAETESLIGFFVNQLVLRTDMTGNPSFRELLERVRDRTLSAYTHQDLPFDKLVEALNPERDLSRAPLFQVKCILQNAPMPPLELPGLTLSLLDIDKGVAEFDLLLILTDTEQGLIADLKYSTDLFKAATVSRLLKNWEIVLNTVVKQPNISLQDIKAILEEANQQHRQAQAQEYQNTLERKFMKVKRKSISGTNPAAAE
ncbi:amino acid adenylation domain-containing protein [Nostoc sp. T09]|uniref:amino acid adenylation domain-containing protein n=1 Tax=Nostoc sp. T09 TaxID=1932621 RepID=UPI000A3BBF37|nr:non-ribosomal peptide synthetase [Nostoc sp. T09]